MAAEVSVFEPRQTAISTPQSRQLQASLVMMLHGMALCRQAAVNAETFTVYAKHLARFPAECVKEAIEALSRRPRGEGETAFPDLGTVEAAVREAVGKRNAAERMRQRREQNERDFWNWIDLHIERSGLSEQEILDRVKTPGYTGRKARK